MKFKKLINYIISAVIAAGIAVIPASAKNNNIVLDFKIDSFCGQTGENESASMLIDEDEEYKTKWCAADGNTHAGEPHWIIFDFASEKTFDRIRLVKASEGESDYGREDCNANSFTFWISNEKISWIRALTVTNDGENPIYEGQFPNGAITARYIKLTVENPEQSDDSDENQAVRLYDFKIWEAEFAEIIEINIPEENSLEIIEDTPPPLIIAPDSSDTSFYLMSMLIFIMLVSGVSVLNIIKQSKK